MTYLQKLGKIANQHSVYLHKVVGFKFQVHHVDKIYRKYSQYMCNKPTNALFRQIY
jgi:hypothetical protein